MRVIIRTDGASRGNPGPAAIGVTIKDPQGKLLATVSRRIGVTTNNQAEYRAIIAGLEKAVSLGAREVTAYADSELLVRQIQGRYRVRQAALRPLYQEIVQLAGALEKFTITHVTRDQNAEADLLANQALDG
ncbi:MAG: ribonuclease HI family protein [Chloroflexota bacterium]